jgi:hypothetical protein
MSKKPEALSGPMIEKWRALHDAEAFAGGDGTQRKLRTHAHKAMDPGTSTVTKAKRALR